MVLVVVVLLLLAATLLVHGALTLARSYRAGGVEGWDAIRVRRAVGARVDAALATGSPGVAGWRVAGADVETRVLIDTLGPELHLIAGAGRVREARWWAGRLAWRGEPASRALAHTAAARTGGGVHRESIGTVEGSPGGGCAEATPLPAIAPLPAEGLRLGPLDAEGVLQRAERWDPIADAEGCAGGACPPRFRASDGGVVLTDGRFSGVLLVRGDVVLGGAAEIRGHLLVEGVLTLRDSAAVVGGVDVLGRLTLEGTGGIRGDRCVLAEMWRSGVAEAVGWVALDSRAWPLWGPPP